MSIFISKSANRLPGGLCSMRKNYLLLFGGMLWFQLGGAQLCQGSLGDPIVNITFGSGANPGPSLPAAATHYQFKYDDCPNDGFYTLRNKTDNCFGGWHSLTSDHTGDPNGYFMLVNASYQPSAFYTDTVDLQCSNTVYEFAAWVMNMNKPYECGGSPIQPNLTFSIERTDGQVLQAYHSGNIAPQTAVAWRQYGFFFRTPPGINRVVLRITNNAQGGCGNDLALDDITFRPCGPMLHASIAGGQVVKAFCEGEAQPQTLTCSVSPGYDNPHFQWQQSTNGGAWSDVPGANELTFRGDFSPSSPPGVYQYRLTVSQAENINIPACRIASNPVSVRIQANPAKTLSANTPLCEGSPLRLSASDGEKYSWTGPGGFVSTAPNITLEHVQMAQAGHYYLEVVSAAGCRRRDTVEVRVNPKPIATVAFDTVFICEGSATTLEAHGGNSYQWTPSGSLSSATAFNPLASPVDSTRYRVVVANSFACTDTAYVQVNVGRKPGADAGKDQYILEGQGAQLSARATGTDVRYGWSPAWLMSDPASLNPVVTPPSDMVFEFWVESNDGCGIDRDSVKVHVFKGVYVPNAFSHNGDGLNDTWNIPALRAYTTYEILVYNRYGQLIFGSKDVGKPWDGRFQGKNQPTGVYPYVITIKDIPLKFTGWVTLIR